MSNTNGSMADLLLVEVINADVFFDPQDDSERESLDAALNALNSVYKHLSGAESSGVSGCSVIELEKRDDRMAEISEILVRKSDDLEVESVFFHRWANILSGFLTPDQLENAFKELSATLAESYDVELNL